MSAPVAACAAFSFDNPLLFVVLKFLNPPPCRPSRSHASQDADTTLRIFVSDFCPAWRRSRRWINPRRSAVLTAFCAVVRLTPANAAILSSGRIQTPTSRTARAMTLKAAISPGVKLAASWGGNAPETAQRRRRSMLACLSGERGRTGLRRALAGAACKSAIPQPDG